MYLINHLEQSNFINMIAAQLELVYVRSARSGLMMQLNYHCVLINILVGLFSLNRLYLLCNSLKTFYFLIKYTDKTEKLRSIPY